MGDGGALAAFPILDGHCEAPTLALAIGQVATIVRDAWRLKLSGVGYVLAGLLVACIEEGQAGVASHAARMDEKLVAALAPVPVEGLSVGDLACWGSAVGRRQP